MILGAHVLLSGEQIPTPPERSESVEQTKPQARQERDRPNSDDSATRDTGSNNDSIDTDTSSITVEATAYTAYCNTGCIGVTKTGVDVSNTIYHEGRRIVAVDPNVVPLGTEVTITLANGEQIKAVAEDTGGAIKGHRIDLLVSNRSRAMEFGRQNVKLTIGG